MKLRTGFVSNSSSTSFMIYGTTISKNLIEEKYDGVYYILEKEFSNSGVEVISDPYCNIYYVGIDYQKMKDEETKL